MAQVEEGYFVCRYCHRELEGEVYLDQQKEDLGQSYHCANCNVTWQVIPRSNGKVKWKVVIQ